VVDPTENVKALSEASSARQDDLREANNKYWQSEISAMRDMMVLRADHAKEIRQLESDRLDKIRQVDVLAGNTAADRALVAIQTLATSQAAAAETLRSMVTSTATTIAAQTAQAMGAVTERIAALEKSSYTGMGRQTVADPQMERLSAVVEKLASAQSVGTGKTAGINWVGAVVAGAVSLFVGLLAIASVLFVVLKK